MGLIAVDSSVLVAALQRWHLFHEQARPVLSRPGMRLIAHVLAETYANLTGRHGLARVAPSMAAETLRRLAGDGPLALSPEGHQRMLRRASEAGLMGGAIYDALIAATAQEAGARLVSLDKRAARTYDVMGVPYELLYS
jgi:predicted nucleic acid-binding protein